MKTNIYSITEKAPEMPCWMFGSDGWERMERNRRPALHMFTHWSPDALTAPLGRPTDLGGDAHAPTDIGCASDAKKARTSDGQVSPPVSSDPTPVAQPRPADAPPDSNLIPVGEKVEPSDAIPADVQAACERLEAVEMRANRRRLGGLAWDEQDHLAADLRLLLSFINPNAQNRKKV